MFTIFILFLYVLNGSQGKGNYIRAALTAAGQEPDSAPLNHVFHLALVKAMEVSYTARKYKLERTL